MKKIAIAILLSTFVAPPAVADLYTGLKLGRVDYSYSGKTNNGLAGYGLLYGDTITKNFSVEGEFMTLGGYVNGNANVSSTAYSLSAVGFHLAKPQYSLFGKLGIVSSSLTATAKAKPGSGQTGSRTIHNIGLTVGFGARYNVSKEVGVRVGVDIYPVRGGIPNPSAVQMVYVCTVLKF